jgi:hypothetical protein
MRIQIIHVPYDSGYRDRRTGRGPGNILRHLDAECGVAACCLFDALATASGALLLDSAAPLSSGLTDDGKRLGIWLTVLKDQKHNA